MFSKYFKTELIWFCSGCLGTWLAGMLVGWPSVALLIFMAVYVTWTLHRLDTVVSWLRSGGKAGRAPASFGLTDEMVRQVHREKKYSKKQKNRFKSALGRFNTLAANLPDAIIVLDNDHEIRWSNPAAQHMLDIHAEKDRGQRISNLIRNPKFSEFLLEPGEHRDVEIQSPTAAGRTLEVRRVPNANKMTVLIAADITQRVKLREMRKAFVADVSHELRTPLTVIRGYLEMLQERENLDPDVREALSELSVQSDRMREIVQALLELSKLEANPLGESEGDIINMGAMLRAMVVPLQKESPEHKFSLNIDDSLAVLGSEREVYSACNNLLTNAIKYTGAGTTINVTWAAGEQGTAVYSVSDDGPGIEPRHLSRLSERFYRVDTGRSREQGGTGLGLAIVKHAVQRHGGTLGIDSTPGRGSTFTAVFPESRVNVLQKVANQ